MLDGCELGLLVLLLLLLFLLLLEEVEEVKLVGVVLLSTATGGPALNFEGADPIWTWSTEKRRGEGGE
jgi:hypothetical protein